MRVLVVEDSEKLQRTLALALRKSGYAVDVCGDGTEAIWMAHETPYDVLVLDIMLPGRDGLTVIREMREHRIDTPVLMLTVKGTVDDRVAGLRAGADDYLTKPFALEELIARVEALVRRRYAERNPVLRIGSIELDTRARTATRNGEAIPLTRREYRLLEYLVLRRGEVISRSELEQRLYSEETEVFSNVIESTISALRKKIESNGEPPILHTRRGMGYYVIADET